MPYATIEGIEKNRLSLILEGDGTELQVYFPMTKTVDSWIEGHPKQFCKKAVIEYVLGKDGKTIIKVMPPTGFKRAVPEHLDQDKKEPVSTPAPRIVDMSCNATIGGSASPSAPEQPLTTSPQAVKFPLTNTGSFDTAKVYGYTVEDTCQMMQFEPLTIKVICDDPDTGRRALIDAWQIFGQNNEVVRETVQKHVERVLLRDVRS